MVNLTSRAVEQDIVSVDIPIELDAAGPVIL